MTPMPSFDMADSRGEPERSPAMMPQPFTIKRVGQRPLRFEGSELCMAMSFVPTCPSWYEINIYRTTAQSFVAAVRLFFVAEGERDRVRAWDCESFDEVLDTLEAYDAGRDVRVDAFPDDPGMTPGDLAAEGFMLRAKVEGARAHYRSLLGEILHELEQAAE